MHRRHFLLKGILGLLLVAIVAYGAVLVVSVVRMKGEVDKATAAYQTCQDCIQRQDYLAAIDAVEDVADSIDVLEREASMWYWEFAERIPVLGQDVDLARDLVVVMDKLANDALMPVLDKVKSVGIGKDENVLSMILGNADAIVAIGPAISRADQTLDECRVITDSMGTSHFEDLNNIATEVRDAVTQADDTFDNIQKFFENPQSLGELLGGEQPAQ